MIQVWARTIKYNGNPDIVRYFWWSFKLLKCEIACQSLQSACLDAIILVVTWQDHVENRTFKNRMKCGMRHAESRENRTLKITLWKRFSAPYWLCERGLQRGEKRYPTHLGESVHFVFCVNPTLLFEELQTFYVAFIWEDCVALMLQLDTYITIYIQEKQFNICMVEETIIFVFIFGFGKYCS